MSYFLIRIGEGSRYVDIAKTGNFIAIGWQELPDLSNYGNINNIKSELEKYYNYSNAQLASQTGQVDRFLNGIKNNDRVLSPLGDGKYLVGKVFEYFYLNNPKDGCPYNHRRKVEWFSRILDKNDMTSNLTYALGASLTIFSLDKYRNEIDSLIEGKEFSPAEKPERVRDVILNGLLELDGKQFEDFLQHLLSIIGFEAQTTQYTGDRGIDVNGILNAEGIAEITLRVQAKRTRSAINNKEILAMRGTLAQGEHACFITLSNFTKTAAEEAEAPGKIPVKLIDGEDLAGLVLKNFENIDDRYKKLFPIKRKMDFNIDDMFELSEDSDTYEDEITDRGKRGIKSEFDTLVCAAKEEGFKFAFLGQKAWWAVRIKEMNLPYIKYLAMYQVAPISAITFYGEVEKIEPYENSGKYKLYLKDIIKLETPIKTGTNPHLKPQGPKYTKLEKILKGKVLEDIF